MKNFTHLYRMNLPHRAVAVYIYLADRANKENICWPAIPTISRDLKLSESTTRRALKDLRKAGLIQTEQRYRENGGTVRFNLNYFLVKTDYSHKYYRCVFSFFFTLQGKCLTSRIFPWLNRFHASF